MSFSHLFTNKYHFVSLYFGMKIGLSVAAPRRGLGTKPHKMLLTPTAGSNRLLFDMVQFFIFFPIPILLIRISLEKGHATSRPRPHHSNSKATKICPQGQGQSSEDPSLVSSLWTCEHKLQIIMNKTSWYTRPSGKYQLGSAFAFISWTLSLFPFSHNSYHKNSYKTHKCALKC